MTGSPRTDLGSLRHNGRLQSFPPYVGGDDDEIDEWLAVCDCGWKGSRKWNHSVCAYGDLTKHLNEALRPSRD